MNIDLNDTGSDCSIWSPWKKVEAGVSFGMDRTWKALILAIDVLAVDVGGTDDSGGFRLAVGVSSLECHFRSEQAFSSSRAGISWISHLWIRDSEAFERRFHILWSSARHAKSLIAPMDFEE